MATRSANIEYTLLFEDDTTQKLTVGPYDPDYMEQTSNIRAIKSNIKSFLDTGLDSDVKKTVVSKYGADWAGFNKVQIIISSRDILF